MTVISDFFKTAFLFGERWRRDGMGEAFGVGGILVMEGFGVGVADVGGEGLKNKLLNLVKTVACFGEGSSEEGVGETVWP